MAQEEKRTSCLWLSYKQFSSSLSSPAFSHSLSQRTWPFNHRQKLKVGSVNSLRYLKPAKATKLPITILTFPCFPLVWEKRVTFLRKHSSTCTEVYLLLLHFFRDSASSIILFWVYIVNLIFTSLPPFQSINKMNYLIPIKNHKTVALSLSKFRKQVYNLFPIFFLFIYC